MLVTVCAVLAAPGAVVPLPPTMCPVNPIIASVTLVTLVTLGSCVCAQGQACSVRSVKKAHYIQCGAASIRLVLFGAHIKGLKGFAARRQLGPCSL
jgi:hypothetical protein